MKTKDTKKRPERPPDVSTAGMPLGERLARLEAGTRVYVSGRITDNDEWEAEFNTAREYLGTFGHVGVLPVENGLPFSSSWGDHLKADLSVIDGCDAILMLQNWKLSRGARIEHEYAVGTRKIVFYQSKNDADLILADKIIGTVCRVSGITVDEMRSGVRTNRLANARLVIIGLVSRTTDLRQQQVASLINRDHSTVATRMATFSDLYKYNKDFRQLVNKVVDGMPELVNQKIV